MHPLPRNPTEWLTEIADAYADAYGALPFMPLVGKKPDEGVLFHIAPLVAIKFRGLADNRAEAATEAAFSSYIGSKEQMGAALDDPHVAFAFCYLAAQFGLGIVSDETIQEVMAYLEEDRRALARAIAQRTRQKKGCRGQRNAK